MGKTYRRDSDFDFKGKRNKNVKKPKKFGKHDDKKKNIHDFLEEENEN